MKEAILYQPPSCPSSEQYLEDCVTARGVEVCRGLAGGAQAFSPVDHVQHVVDGGHFRFSQPIYHHLEQRKDKLNLCKVDSAAGLVKVKL